MSQRYITDTIAINQECIRFVIGKKGNTIDSVKRQTNCTIYNEGGGSVFTIKGLPENVWKAKCKIVDIALSGKKNDENRRENSSKPPNQQTLGNIDAQLSENILSWVVECAELTRAIKPGDESMNQEQLQYVSSLPYGTLKEDHWFDTDREKLVNILDNLKTTTEENKTRIFDEVSRCLKSIDMS